MKSKLKSFTSGMLMDNLHQCHREYQQYFTVMVLRTVCEMPLVKALARQGLGPCQVCRAPAHGYHYGAKTCYPCKHDQPITVNFAFESKQTLVAESQEFFRRKFSNADKLRCTVSCSNKQFRVTKCVGCWMKRCIKIGMSCKSERKVQCLGSLPSDERIKSKPHKPKQHYQGNTIDISINQKSTRHLQKDNTPLPDNGNGSLRRHTSPKARQVGRLFQDDCMTSKRKGNSLKKIALTKQRKPRKLITSSNLMIPLNTATVHDESCHNNSSGLTQRLGETKVKRRLSACSNNSSEVVSVSAPDEELDYEFLDEVHSAVTPILSPDVTDGVDRENERSQQLMIKKVRFDALEHRVLLKVFRCHHLFKPANTPGTMPFQSHGASQSFIVTDSLNSVKDNETGHHAIDMEVISAVRAIPDRSGKNHSDCDSLNSLTLSDTDRDSPNKMVNKPKVELFQKTIVDVELSQMPKIGEMLDSEQRHCESDELFLPKDFSSAGRRPHKCTKSWSREEYYRRFRDSGSDQDSDSSSDELLKRKSKVYNPTHTWHQHEDKASRQERACSIMEAERLSEPSTSPVNLVDPQVYTATLPCTSPSDKNSLSQPVCHQSSPLNSTVNLPVLPEHPTDCRKSSTNIIKDSPESPDSSDSIDSSLGSRVMSGSYNISKKDEKSQSGEDFSFAALQLFAQPFPVGALVSDELPELSEKDDDALSIMAPTEESFSVFNLSRSVPSHKRLTPWSSSQQGASEGAKSTKNELSTSFTSREKIPSAVPAGTEPQSLPMPLTKSTSAALKSKAVPNVHQDIYYFVSEESTDRLRCLGVPHRARELNQETLTIHTTGKPQTGAIMPGGLSPISDDENFSDGQSVCSKAASHILGANAVAEKAMPVIKPLPSHSLLTPASGQHSSRITTFGPHLASALVWGPDKKSNSKPDMKSRSKPDMKSRSKPNMKSLSQPNMVPRSQPDMMSRSQPDMMSRSQPDMMSRSQPDMMSRSRSDMMSRSRSDMMPRSQPDMMSRSQPDMMSRSQPDMMSRSQPDMMSRSQPDMMSRCQPDMMSRCQPDMMSRCQPDMMSRCQPDMMSRCQPDMMSRCQPDMMSRCQPDMMSRCQPDMMSRSQPDMMSRSQSDVKAHSQPDVKSHSKPDVKSHSKPDVKSHSKLDVKSNSKPEQKAGPAKRCTSPVKRSFCEEQVLKGCCMLQNCNAVHIPGSEVNNYVHMSSEERLAEFKTIVKKSAFSGPSKIKLAHFLIEVESNKETPIVEEEMVAFLLRHYITAKAVAEARSMITDIIRLKITDCSLLDDTQSLFHPPKYDVQYYELCEYIIANKLEISCQFVNCLLKWLEKFQRWPRYWALIKLAYERKDTRWTPRPNINVNLALEVLSTNFPSYITHVVFLLERLEQPQWTKIQPHYLKAVFERLTILGYVDLVDKLQSILLQFLHEDPSSFFRFESLVKPQVEVSSQRPAVKNEAKAQLDIEHPFDTSSKTPLLPTPCQFPSFVKDMIVDNNVTASGFVSTNAYGRAQGLTNLNVDESQINNAQEQFMGGRMSSQPNTPNYGLERKVLLATPSDHQPYNYASDSVYVNNSTEVHQRHQPTKTAEQLFAVPKQPQILKFGDPSATWQPVKSPVVHSSSGNPFMSPVTPSKVINEINQQQLPSNRITTVLAPGTSFGIHNATRDMRDVVVNENKHLVQRSGSISVTVNVDRGDRTVPAGSEHRNPNKVAETDVKATKRIVTCNTTSDTSFKNGTTSNEVAYFSRVENLDRAVQRFVSNVADQKVDLEELQRFMLEDIAHTANRYEKFIAALAGKVNPSLQSRVRRYLGQLGVALFKQCHRSRQFVMAFRLLMTLHKENINYYELQETSSHGRAVTMSKLALSVVEVCLCLNKFRSAMHALKAADWAVPCCTSLSHHNERLLRVKLFYRLVQLLLDNNCYLDASLVTGKLIESYEEDLSTLQKDYLDVMDLSDLCDKVVVTLLQQNRLDLAYRMHEKSTGVKLAFEPSTLRALIQMLTVAGQQTSAEDLFLISCQGGVYPLQSYTWPWCVHVRSYFTQEEVGLIIKYFLCRLAKDLRNNDTSLGPVSKQVLRINLEVMDAPDLDRQLNVLSVPSSLQDVIERVRCVAAQLDPPLNVLLRGEQRILEVTAASLRNYFEARGIVPSNGDNSSLSTRQVAWTAFRIETPASFGTSSRPFS